MQAAELRKMSTSELREEEKRIRSDLVTLRFQAGTRQLVASANLSKTRRDLARVLTIARQITSREETQKDVGE